MDDVCSECGTRVIPMADGRCPSCMRPFVGKEFDPIAERVALEKRRRQAESASTAKRAAGNKQVRWGVLLIVVGLGATAFSYMAADTPAGGGKVIVFYGAVLVGILQVFRGLSR